VAELTIGELAATAGVGIETVRFYERKGLLAEPRRSAAGYRQYDDDAVRRLGWIRRAKALGFTLAEIAELLASGVDSPADIATAATTKLIDLDAEIDRLDGVRDRLRTLVDLCVAGDDLACVRLDGVVES
jgi:MerR family transcriptional regulator, copper efflux regulator